MKTKSALIAITLCVSILGCAVQQTSRTSTGWTQADIDSAIAEANQRCDARVADPKIDPIRQHLPLLRTESATLQQMGSKKKPTSREKDAIVAWDAALELCMQELKNVDLAAGIRQDQYEANADSLFLAQKQAKAKLWAGQISYGEYIEAATANRRKWADRQQEIRDGIRSAQIQQAQANAQQQQATAQALMLFNQTASRYRQPVQTNCVKIGGQTSCTSY